MDRRSFAVGVGALAAGGLALAGSAAADDAGRELRNRFSVMLWTLEKLGTFDERLGIVAAAGYTGVELTGEFQRWSEEEMARVLARMRALGLMVDSMSGVRAGFAVEAQSAQFRAEFGEHLQYAQKLSCGQVILLSGKRIADVAAEAQRATAVRNLKWAGEAAAKAGVEIVIEPIDRLEDAGVWMTSVTEAFDLVRAVGLPGVRVLYDFYHEQRGAGNLLEKLQGNIDLVGLVHVADVPGRHEPGTGEIAYSSIYRTLGRLKYRRRIAMEYYPTGDPVVSLRRARMEAEAGLLAGGSALPG